VTELVLKSPTLSLKDLPFLQELGRIENGVFLLKRSPKGYKIKTSVSIPLEKILAVGQRGLVEYILNSLIRERPSLIPFALENESLIGLARYFLRYRSGSLQSFYAYTDTVSRYSAWLGNAPDLIIADAKSENGLLDPMQLQRHTRLLEDYLATLQDRGLTPGRVHGCAKHIKTFYKISGIDVKLPHALSRRVVYKDRSPKPEELQRLLEITDFRGKAIVTTLALGGFREGTLVRLRYRHVREDLEKGVIPLHVNVESEITKGKYHDYDTFLGAEAVESLKSYLDARRKGLLDRDIPREVITDDSPLIRDQQFRTAKPVGEKQIRKLVHRLYLKAGLVKNKGCGRYELCVHSLRKFFKTQLIALGVQPEYVEYMMGHTISTYHDIQSKGIEFLRDVYATAGLSIAPKRKGWELDALKAFARGLGLEPERVLTQAAFAEPHRAYATPEDQEQAQARTLSLAIKELIKNELLATQESPNPENSLP